MDRFEAAARGTYICFRSAGGKLIIVKRLWACYMEKALYKCTTLPLYFTYRLKFIEILSRINLYYFNCKNLLRNSGQSYIIFTWSYFRQVNNFESELQNFSVSSRNKAYLPAPNHTCNIFSLSY